MENKSILLVGILGLLAGCQHYNSQKVVKSQAMQVSSPGECEAASGRWQRAGLMGKFMCIFDYSDAGKPCTSSSQCESDCISSGSQDGSGHCKMDTNPFGCRQSVEEWARGEPVLCLD